MQAHIMYLHTNSTPGVGVKGQIILLLKVVMLHIKLMWIEHRAPYKHILCPYTHPLPLGWGQKGKAFLITESSHVAYQIKENGTQSIM